jgi:hypothetical protein
LGTLERLMLLACAVRRRPTTFHETLTTDPAGYRGIRYAAGYEMLESLGNLGDFLGGVGVVITLIYLAVQIRQNTAQLRSTAEQARLSSLDEINRELDAWQSDLVVSEEVSSIWLRGLKGDEQLRGADGLRFEYHGARLVHIWQGNYFRYLETGDAENWGTNIRHIKMFLSWPGFRAYWDRTKHLQTEAFQAEMHRIATEPQAA